MIKELSVNQWSSSVLSRSLELIVGLSIFATVAAGGLVRHVASTSLVVLLAISFFYVRSWPKTWRQLTSAEQLVLIGFCLYVISAFLSYYNVSDDREYLKHLGKYARFLVIVPVYLLLSRLNLKLFPYILNGAIIAGPLYLGTALLSITDRPGFPAQGHYHHIIFGDTAMLSAIFMATVLFVMKTNKILKIALVISIICTLCASILSQARGAWLALPFCLVLLLYVAVHYKKIRIWMALIVPVLLAVAVVLTPAADIVSTRWQKAVDDIELYQSENKIFTSVGIRLAMWEVAVDVWKRYPIVGTGPGDFYLEMQSDKVQEKYEVRKVYKKMPVISSTHNIFMQSLATTGAIGFVVMCSALFVLPFRLFYMTRLKGDGINVVSLSGIVVLIAFAVFGLTESWILRAPMVSVFLIYIVTLMCAASREEDA